MLTELEAKLLAACKLLLAEASWIGSSEYAGFEDFDENKVAMEAGKAAIAAAEEKAKD